MHQQEEATVTTSHGPTTSKGGHFIFGGTLSEITEHGNVPSVMEERDQPHFMPFIFDNSGERMVEHGIFPLTMEASKDVFDDIMEAAPLWDSYSETSTEAEHGMFPSAVEESDDAPHLRVFIIGGVMDVVVEHRTFPSTKVANGVEYGDVCTRFLQPT